MANEPVEFKQINYENKTFVVKDEVARALATTDTPGRVKPDGTTINIDENGVISSAGGSGSGVNVTATLLSNGWDSNTKRQTVTFTGYQASMGGVIGLPVSATDAQEAAFTESGIFVYSNSGNSFTFECETIPSVDIPVTIDAGGGGGASGQDLVVTCHSTYAGLTITCTDGETTYTETCPSSAPYEVTFSGLTTGSWTVSVIYDGDTYSVTTFVGNDDTLPPPLPDGKTVTPTDDVQTLLHCAGIFDKFYYTTINDVLNDKSTFYAVVSSENAADYLSRCTTFASDVCSDESAMIIIGANDYCADALLQDSDWSEAINDSQYFENILNYKVPTMTSNTTPSGECFGSNCYYYWPSTGDIYYKAFDNVETSYAGSGKSATFTLGYEFPNNILVKRISSTCKSYRPKTLQLQGSKDGINYTNIGSQCDINGETNVFTYSSNIEIYKHLRILCTNGNFGEGYINELQIYGREYVQEGE